MTLEERIEAIRLGARDGVEQERDALRAERDSLKAQLEDARAKALQEAWSVVDDLQVRCNLRGDHAGYDLARSIGVHIRALAEKGKAGRCDSRSR